MIALANIIKNKSILIPFGILILFFTTFAFAHGPKGHREGDFTALQAVKKGMTLYDRLVSSGKLEESWETDLVKIEIESKDYNGKKEYVVKFNRKSSEPKTVFIFFSGNGEYKGSNFTGE